MNQERRALKRTIVETYAIMTEETNQNSKRVLIRDINEEGLMIYQFRGAAPSDKNIVLEVFNPMTRSIFHIYATVIRCERVATRLEINLKITRKTRSQKSHIQNIMWANPVEIGRISL